MKLTSAEIRALNFAKDITVAKLSAGDTSPSNAASGKEIGEMFTEIYKAIIAIAEEDS